MVKVLYIAGFGRSGSTLVSNVVGSASRVFQVGEVVQLFHSGWMTPGTCGCGRRVVECDVWASIVTRAYGSIDPEVLRQINRLRTQCARWRYFLPLIRGKTPAPIATPLRSYVDRLDNLYRAIAEVSGARMVVDSSKQPTYAAVLARVPSVQLYVLHLVRDARAAAYSWMRRKIRTDFPGQLEMVRHTPARSSMLWWQANVGTELGWGRSPRYLRLRYEAFVADPMAATRWILHHIDEPEVETALSQSGAVHFGENHMIESNPNRSVRGVVDIRSDDEWQTGMSRGQKALVMALTWPLQLRYGYSLGDPRRLNLPQEPAPL